MKKTFAILLVTLLTTTAFSQVEIKLSDVSFHVGDSVTLSGQVVSGRFLSSSKGGPTLLNVGAPYPNQLLTLVVWADDRKHFDEAPEVVYLKKQVKVTGKVELFKDKPQIVLYSDKQITVLTDSTATPKEGNR